MEQMVEYMQIVKSTKERHVGTKGTTMTLRRMPLFGISVFQMNRYSYIYILGEFEPLAFLT